MVVRLLSTLLPGMATALEDEIDAARRQGGDRVRMTDGRLVGQSQTGWIYEFRLETETWVPDDCGVDIQVGPERWAGSVVMIEGFAIVIEVEQELPNRLRRALLIVKLWYILERLRDRLTEIAERPLGIGEIDLLRFLTPDEPRMNPPRERTVGADLNDQQRSAVLHALSNMVTVIWGPPGTGKTTTIGKLLAAAERSGQRCLVLAYSNAAVDTAMLAAARNFRGPPEYMAGRVLRLGTPRLSEVANHPWLSAAAAVRIRQPDLVARENELRRALANAREAGSAAALAEIREQLHMARQEIRKASAELARGAQILGCTLATAAINQLFDTYTCDRVVLDEASMTSIPFAALAASFSRRCLTIAGDFRQLPPVVLAETEAANHWLKRHLFDHAGIVDRVRAGEGDVRLVMLEEQYRMHERIADVVSRTFYQGRLRGGEGTSQRTEKIAARLPLGGCPILVLDTGPLGPSCLAEPRQIGRSRFNLLNALVCVAIIAEGIDDHESVAVIAPFRAQATLLQRLVDDLGWAGRVRVATVHRFQGGEADVVVLDLTTASPHDRLGPLLSGDAWSLAGRLLNVAVSRARGKLIVVAHCQHIVRRAASEDIVVPVLRDLIDRGRHIAIDSDRLVMGIERTQLQRLVSLEPQPLLSCSSLEMAATAADGEVALALESPAPAPVWAEAAGERGVPVIVTGRGLLGGWQHVRMARVVDRHPLATAGLVDRRRIWVQLPDGRHTVSVDGPLSAPRIGELLGVLPDDQQGPLANDPDRIHEVGPIGIQCRECNELMWLDDGRYGAYLRCLNAACGQTRRLMAQDVQNLIVAVGFACPECEGLPVARQTGFGVYVQCDRCGWRRHANPVLEMMWVATRER